MLAVSAGAIDNMMQFMCQDASQSTPQQHVAIRAEFSVGRAERAADMVAFHFGERNDFAAGYVRIPEGNGLAGQRRRQGVHLAASVECDYDDARERIRGGEFASAPP